MVFDKELLGIWSRGFGEEGGVVRRLLWLDSPRLAGARLLFVRSEYRLVECSIHSSAWIDSWGSDPVEAMNSDSLCFPFPFPFALTFNNGVHWSTEGSAEIETVGYETSSLSLTPSSSPSEEPSSLRGEEVGSRGRGRVLDATLGGGGTLVLVGEVGTAAG